MLTSLKRFPLVAVLVLATAFTAACDDDPADEDDDDDDGVWELTVLDLDAGTYEYKYHINGNWVDNMCDDPEWGDNISPQNEGCVGGFGNATITVAQGEDVTFTYEPPAGVTVDSISVPGMFNNWNPDAPGFAMSLDDD